MISKRDDFLYVPSQDLDRLEQWAEFLNENATPWWVLFGNTLSPDDAALRRYHLEEHKWLRELWPTPFKPGKCDFRVEVMPDGIPFAKVKTPGLVVEVPYRDTDGVRYHAEAILRCVALDCGARRGIVNPFTSRDPVPYIRFYRFGRFEKNIPVIKYTPKLGKAETRLRKHNHMKLTLTFGNGYFANPKRLEHISNRRYQTPTSVESFAYQYYVIAEQALRLELVRLNRLWEAEQGKTTSP